ncbi:MAG: signal peptidase I [Gaiellaceae bacterium]
MRNPVDRLTEGLPHPVRVAIDWIVTLGGAVLVVLLLKAFVVNPYRIPSSSMEPTLHCARPSQGCESETSDRVLANRFIYHLREPKRGDVVVFETPPQALVRCGAGGVFVKRLVGLPGETVSERNGRIFIDGKPLDEPYVQLGRRDEESGGWDVPPGHYFMMGDNRRNSCDSRVWGAVARDHLIGTVFARYWPPSRIALR